jgi:hypothetical protein
MPEELSFQEFRREADTIDRNKVLYFPDAGVR